MKPAPRRYVGSTVRIQGRSFMILHKKKVCKKKFFDLAELCNVEGRSGFTFGERFQCSNKALNKLTRS